MYSKYGWILLLLRAVFYSAIIIFFIVATSSPNESIRGIAGGVILADIVTWLGWSLFKLGRYLAKFAWDAVITIAVVIVFIYVFKVPFPTGGEGMALGMMSFFVVSGIKIFWYVLLGLTEEE
jgi:hypothetical protein